MKIDPISMQSNQIAKSYNTKNSFKSKIDMDNLFDTYGPQALPENKAIQIVTRPGLINLINIITLPLLGFCGISLESDFKLVDIDPNNITPQQEKLIRTGKLINFIPAGYHIENNKVVKNK